MSWYNEYRMTFYGIALTETLTKRRRWTRATA
jgi:hypothetical protein